MDNTVAIIITLVLSAFFSGMEIAFIASNKLKIEIDKGKGLLSAQILSQFYRHPSRLIGALLLGNNIALVVYGIAMANILTPFFKIRLPESYNSDFIILLIQTIVATLVILLLAEFLPKTLFRMNANGILKFLAVPVWIVYYLLYPVVFLFTGISQLILRIFLNERFKKEEQVFTYVDLDQYIQDLAKNEEQIEDVQQEIQMFQNMIDFRTAKLRETMVPRNEIIAVQDTGSLDDLRSVFIRYGFSRIPVYNGSIDNIIGYVHSFDMFRNPETMASLIKPILFIPETMPANAALSLFIRERKNIAVVVDEFGGTSGMVTMEDIIEEIFGEIDDEFDAEEMTEKVIGPGEYVFSARLEIDYLNSAYKLELSESEEYKTLAGLIIHVHESIPGEGETIFIPPYRFDILQASETRIELVRLKHNSEG
ncbi:MAG: hemolysin family protein [Bacteroidales bacterium]|jgi:CBS domain containing-hemolysin-like protein|nr:hemolysin family protein [Bacteroidales bacterium]